MLLMSRRRKIAAVGMVLVLLLSLRAGYSFLRFYYVQRNFDRIGVGFTRESVLGILGRPNYHAGACLHDLKLSTLCEREFVYSIPVTPWIPEYYVVDLSRDGRVIKREHLISP